MSDRESKRVRIECFEAEDAIAAVNNLLDEEEWDDKLRFSGYNPRFAEDLVNAIGGIYEKAKLRGLRAAGANR